MTTDNRESDNNIGRRKFLKSIFGLRAMIEDSAEAEAKTSAKGKVIPPSAPVFIWGDLKNGNVGFPTGLNLGGGLPGSVMKLIAAAAMHEEGLINPNHIYECSGHITMHDETFNCLHAHGRVNLTHAIAKSCNVYFVQAAEKLSSAMFLQYAKRFGLDQPCARRGKGAFPEKPVHPSYKYVLGLAEDLSPNSLQLMRIAALVATKGDAPFFHSADDVEPGERFKIELSEGTWHRLQQGMQLACSEGTAIQLDPEHRLHTAAKTGTVPRGTKFTSWIIGYFPIDNPKNVFVLNSTAGTSQEAAVPQAHKFLYGTTWP
ncbi:MAG TPA: penicillin-binding transpeptidase domain-containing protein [Drouetiella sp.]